MARRDTRGLRVRGQGLALHHAHAAPGRCAHGACELPGVGRPGAGAEAGPLPVATAAAHAFRRAAHGPFPVAAAARRQGRGGAGARARRAGERPLGADRAARAASAASTPCRRGASPELCRPGFHRTAAPPRRGAGGRRHGRAVAAHRRPHGRLRLHPPAWRQGALRQRLRRCRARPLGRAHPGLARRAPGGRCGAGVTSGRAARAARCYFDNDTKVHAPYDAARLARRLGLRTGLGDDGRFAGIDETDGIELPAASYKSA